jgi:hypothetical protein
MPETGDKIFAAVVILTIESEMRGITIFSQRQTSQEVCCDMRYSHQLHSIALAISQWCRRIAQQLHRFALPVQIFDQLLFEYQMGPPVCCCMSMVMMIAPENYG